MQKIQNIILSLCVLITVGCSNMNYTNTVPNVDLNKFIKKWYVIAGRFTFLEQGAHNAVEEYRYSEDEKKIDINFYFNKDSFDGPLKKIPQNASIEDRKTNAYWKVSPFWPLKFDYLVIALAEDYSWTAIGVPNQKYLWIMADHWEVSDKELEEITDQIKQIKYNVESIKRIPQKWPNSN